MLPRALRFPLQPYGNRDLTLRNRPRRDEATPLPVMRVSQQRARLRKDRRQFLKRIVDNNNKTPRDEKPVYKPPKRWLRIDIIAE